MPRYDPRPDNGAIARTERKQTIMSDYETGADDTYGLLGTGEEETGIDDEAGGLDFVGDDESGADDEAGGLDFVGDDESGADDEVGAVTRKVKKNPRAAAKKLVQQRRRLASATLTFWRAVLMEVSWKFPRPT